MSSFICSPKHFISVEKAIQELVRFKKLPFKFVDIKVNDVSEIMETIKEII